MMMTEMNGEVEVRMPVGVLKDGWKVVDQMCQL